MKNLLVGGLLVGALAAGAGGGPMLVVDYDRDGQIGGADMERAERGEPFVFWLNDDNDAAGDGDTNKDLDDIPGGGDERDCDDEAVNGRCDLLDFVPVLIDVNGVDGSVTWKLHGESANAVFTKLSADQAGDFHTKDATDLDDNPLREAPVTPLGGEGAELPDGFLIAGRGVIIVEGRKLGSEGLTLRGYDGKGNAIAGCEAKANLTVADVEKMYRWMNLRQACGDKGGRESTYQNEPPARPDAMTDARHFVFVHGYNTNREEARGNAAEFFKKLWQSGCDAKFTAVEWRGDESQIELFPGLPSFTPNYYQNEANAFVTARAFKDACDKLPGELILVGHSLGATIISSAIKDYGLDYLRCVLLNAAVPREAYDADAYDEAMVDDDWLDGKIPLTDRASRWYQNFAARKYDPYEYRRKLAWRGRFADHPRTVNYYSPSDNVLANPAADEADPDKVPQDEVMKLLARKVGFGFWAFSEKMKGTWMVNALNEIVTNVADVTAMKCEGGWGMNEDYDEDAPAFDPANTRFTPFLDERMKERGMLDILPSETERLRAQHLADAIPAESFAAGANEVATLANVNLEQFIGDNPDWPHADAGDKDGDGDEAEKEWRHSSFREVAYYHTSKFYASLAAIEPQRVIIDTDLGSCMDDLFAIDLAARMHRAGKLNLLAVVMDRPDGSNPDDDPHGRGQFLDFADRYLASLGLGADFPLGASMALSSPDRRLPVINPYWTLVNSNDVAGIGFKPSGRDLASVPNAVTLYRRLLADSPDGSVVISSIGFYNNLCRLMDSAAGDDDVNMDGMELIRRKVRELRVMGGCFDGSVEQDRNGKGEYNVEGDIPAAKRLFSEWPTPVICTPWEVGKKLEYRPMIVLSDFPPGTESPTIRAVYKRWSQPPTGCINRLWDVMTVLPLTFGDAVAPLSPKGGIDVNDKGQTVFIEDASSNRCYQIGKDFPADAAMNRLREIYRTGNPSVSMLVSGQPEPGIDYNGSELLFKFKDISLGRYAADDLFFSFYVFLDDMSYEIYEPDRFDWDETLGVLDVHFTVPPEVVTAGNLYEGSLDVFFWNDEIGDNTQPTAFRQIVQGAVDRDKPYDWFWEYGLEVPTNFVPAAVGWGVMPERNRAIVDTTFRFEEASPETDDPPEGVAQAAVRIVADGEGGYKFQYYGFVGKDNGYYRKWHDFNVGGGNVHEIKPVLDETYVVRMEGFYNEDANNGVNTLVFSVKLEKSNEGFVKQFVGNLVNKNGGLYGTTRLNSVELAGDGTVFALEGMCCSNVVNVNLARIDGDAEYATVAEAVAAAGGRPVRLLHAASWRPTAVDVGVPVRILNKSWLHLDLSGLPAGHNPVWTDVDGNNGTMTLAQCPGLTIEGTTDLPGDFFLSFIGSRDLVMLSATGGVAWTKHEEQPEGRLQPVTGFWDFKRHFVNGETYYSYHDNTGMYDHFGMSGFAPGERVILDASFNEVKRITFEASGTVEKGHPLDGHDFLMIDLDHYILSGYLTNTVYNVPGREEKPSQAAYSYLQEVKDGEVVWDWKSTDYPELYTLTVTNADEYAADFANEHTTAPDYVHFNAMRLNAGGDLVCSFRHIDAVICLDRSAKENQIRWILSGKGDQFKLPDEAKTSAQHYVTVEGDDTITVFDNGNGRDPKLTRVMRYVINTNEMTATPTVLYAPTDKFSAMCGSAQVLDGGTLVVGWGGATRDADCLSVVTNGTTQMRVTLANPTDFTYRAVYCPPATSGKEPVTPENPIVCKTAEEASNRMAKAVFMPSAAVSAALTTDAARRTYRNMFTLDVVPTTGDLWAVEAFLIEEAWTNLVETARAATRQIDVAGISALPLGVATNVTVTGCEPGFFYSLYNGKEVTNVKANVDARNRNVLCGVDAKVAFPYVAKPLPEAGFFSIGASTTPTVEPGVVNTYTNIPHRKPTFPIPPGW